MKTILVIGPHPEFMETVRAALNPEGYRVIHRSTLEESEPILGAGLLDACLVDVELTDARSTWFLDAVRRRLRNRPLVVFTGSRQWEWEEEAYLQGAQYVLSKPVRGRLLNAVLERLWNPGAKPAPLAAAAPMPPPGTIPPPNPVSPPPGSGHTLHILRDFSSILTHSLEAEPMFRQFLLLIREILDVNRAAIFLRQPAGLGAGSGESPGFRSACALGLPPGLLEHFQLSIESGLGGFLNQQGRILRRDSPEALGDAELRKEFEVLGAQAAIPILDRERLVGIATLDGRVTGEALTNSELALVFHLLEELGLAVKNIWLHEQLAANNEMMANILRELSSGCVVVSSDLSILHANKMARSFFSLPGARNIQFEFNHLPAELGSKVYQVLQTGCAVIPFKFEPPDSSGAVYHVAVVPFQKANAAQPSSALLIVDDQTQAEQLKRLELEAGNLRLVRNMAERLAHEINNAVMPLDTYQQVMKKEIKELPASVKNSDFWVSLGNTLAEGVKRISRRGAQMRVMAQDALVLKGIVEFGPLLEDAYEEAQKHHTSGSIKLSIEGAEGPLMISGDRESLKLAFSELFLNALQANPKETRIQLRAQTETASDDTRWVHLEIRDNGPGFSAECLQNACKPFYRTKVIGLGLGLAVAQKIIDMHQGKLALSNAPDKSGGRVRVSLPLDSSSAVKA